MVRSRGTDRHRGCDGNDRCGELCDAAMANAVRNAECSRMRTCLVIGINVHERCYMVCRCTILLSSSYLFIMNGLLPKTFDQNSFLSYDLLKR